MCATLDVLKGTPMPGIDWIHLPQEVEDAVCMCRSKGKEDRKGYSLDPKSGYWVHDCGKPELRVAVQKCDLCDKVFVPKTYKEVKYSYMGISCYDH